MTDTTNRFYDSLAHDYHLLYPDWNAAIQEEGRVLARLLGDPVVTGPVLDCACGIGTQTLGLLQAGFDVDGSDLSPGAVARAAAEASARHLAGRFWVDDLRTLEHAARDHYGVALACENAMPHLDNTDDIRKALVALRDRVRAGGQVVLGLTDYAPLLAERPSQRRPRFFGGRGHRLIVHQGWDWHDEKSYDLHVFMTLEGPPGEWTSRHHVGHCRAVTLEEVASLASDVGLERVEVLQPVATGYHQPLIRAWRR